MLENEKKKILNEGWEAHGSGKMKMSVFFKYELPKQVLSELRKAWKINKL